MAIKVLLLVSLVALAAASLRPSTSDELHEMVLWAQRVQEGKAPLQALLHDKQGPPQLKPKQKQPQRVPPQTPPPPPPTPQRISHGTPPPPPPTSQRAWAPPPFADDVELLRPGLPAHEEYDRSLRFSHSILHGFRDAQ